VEAQRRRAGLALAATAASLALGAGCGGDDGATPGAFAADADAVCADVVRTSAALGRLRPEDEREVVAVLGRLERTLADGVRRLEALDRPGGEDGAAASAFVQAFGAEFRAGRRPALRALRDAARARDVPALRRAVARLRAVDDSGSRAAARRVGAERCAA
jgi:hypothetical protein